MSEKPNFILKGNNISSRLFYVLAAVIPFQIYINIGQYPIAIGYIIVALIGIWAVIRITKHPIVIVPRLLLSMVLFVGTTIFSYTSAPSKSSFFIDFFQLMLFFSLYFLTVNSVKNFDVAQNLITIVFAATVFSALLGVAQFLIAQIDPEFVIGLWYEKFGKWVFGVRGIERISSVEGRGFFFRSELPGVGSAFRVFGMFGGGNAYGFFQALMFPLVLEIVSQKRRWRYTWRVLIVVVTLASPILSWSRMSWLMILIGLSYWGVSRLVKRPISILSPVHLVGFSIAILLVISMLLFFANQLPDWAISKAIIATVSRSDASTIARLYSMQRGLEISMEHVWFGGGFGNFASLFAGSPVDQPTVITAENLYIELLAEVGIVGLGAFLMVMFGVWKESWYIARRGSSEVSKAFGRAMCSMWLVLIVGFFFNAGLIEPKTMLMWWLLVGLTSAIRRIETLSGGLNQ